MARGCHEGGGPVRWAPDAKGGGRSGTMTAELEASGGGAAPDAGGQARRGLLLVISSPSGAGKTTLTRRLLARDPAVTLSVSATTRPPRTGEVDGKHYFFVDHARFAEMVEGGELLEHAEVFGNRYGSPRAPVEAALAEGRDVLFDVDWQGADQLRATDLAPSIVSIFILPPSIAELERRLRARAADPDDVIEARMRQAWGEISHWSDYGYVLMNDDLDRCYSQIETILAAERLRRVRQTWLEARVAGLFAEFERGGAS